MPPQPRWPWEEKVSTPEVLPSSPPVMRTWEVFGRPPFKSPENLLSVVVKGMTCDDAIVEAKRKFSSMPEFRGAPPLIHHTNMLSPKSKPKEMAPEAREVFYRRRAASGTLIRNVDTTREDGEQILATLEADDAA
jgi:hypothetical protein